MHTDTPAAARCALTAPAVQTPGTAQPWGTHPTRKAPLCRDCQHGNELGLCNHPSAPCDVVSGAPTLGCKSMRDVDSLKAPGSPLQLCGPEGKLFKPRAGAAGG